MADAEGEVFEFNVFSATLGDVYKRQGLRTIGAHCLCSRTLVGPVLIPASVTSIGEGSFEYAIVRLAAADAVVHITSDQLIS